MNSISQPQKVQKFQEKILSKCFSPGDDIKIIGAKTSKLSELSSKNILFNSEVIKNNYNPKWNKEFAFQTSEKKIYIWIFEVNVISSNE